MTQAIAVFNAGSSSLKFSAFAVSDLRLLAHGQLDHLGADPAEHDAALSRLLADLPARLQGHQLAAVGHRIVHGGRRFHDAVRLDASVLAELATLTPLAPLHQPHNLSPAAALGRLQPGLPQVACFDTAFHAGNPEVAQRFALPRDLHEAGVRRYGFHGLSYEYIASRLPEVDPVAAQGRTIVLHLGNGASACAMRGGRSLASSMGFTALDGLMMGTRCGNIDPGVLLWLMDERGLSARQIEHLLYSESGLLGVSGLSADMRTLMDSPAPEAAEALALYAYRIQREVGALAAVLGGVDAIVFTAGIGEHAAALRARVAHDAAWLGAEIDEAANAAATGLADGQAQRLSPPGSRVALWVIPTDEERTIARHTRRLVWPALG
jgi:acetate kinase